MVKGGRRQRSVSEDEMVLADLEGAEVASATVSYARERRRRQGRGEDQGLAGLDVDPHPDDEIGIFLQELFKILHDGILSASKGKNKSLSHSITHPAADVYRGRGSFSSKILAYSADVWYILIVRIHD